MQNNDGTRPHSSDALFGQSDFVSLTELQHQQKEAAETARGHMHTRVGGVLKGEPVDTAETEVGNVPPNRVVNVETPHGNIPRSGKINDAVERIHHALEMGLIADEPMPEGTVDIRTKFGNVGADGQLHMEEGKKETNPKDAVGVRKARWFSYLPIRVLIGVGLALLEGARKYGRHNYRVAGVRASVYVDAVVCGHLMPWMEGEDLDPDTAELDAEGKPIPGTGLNHLDKAIASLIVLRDGIYEGNWVDDRPPSVANWQEFIQGQHKKACAIIDRYPNAVPSYTRKDTRPRE